jgi:hypothetical protein
MVEESVSSFSLQQLVRYTYLTTGLTGRQTQNTLKKEQGLLPVVKSVEKSH